MRVLVHTVFLICTLTSGLAAQTIERQARVAVLDFGNTQTGKRIADQIAKGFKDQRIRQAELQIIDRDQARAAAIGIGYKDSINMTLPEARDLGSAIGCDFFFAGEAQTLRRSPSTGPAYFESYASIFLVSARTGRLILWERPAIQRANPEAAEQGLLSTVAAEDAGRRYTNAMLRALDDERNERTAAVEVAAPLIEDAPNDGDSAVNGLQMPRPYRRLKPPYPDQAAQAEVEATVDVLVDVDAQGEVSRVEVWRWAGYGLDRSVTDTVKQLHFFPAMRDGKAIPVRVLLRYNFRKPPKDARTAPAPS